MKPAENFNAESDAEALRKAMKGFGELQLSCSLKMWGTRVTIITVCSARFFSDLVCSAKGEYSDESTLSEYMYSKVEMI